MGETKGASNWLPTISYQEVPVNLLFYDCRNEIIVVGPGDLQLTRVGNALSVEGNRQLLSSRGNTEDLHDGVFRTFTTPRCMGILGEQKGTSAHCCHASSPSYCAFEERPA